MYRSVQCKLPVKMEWSRREIKTKQDRHFMTFILNKSSLNMAYMYIKTYFHTIIHLSKYMYQYKYPLYMYITGENCKDGFVKVYFSRKE